MSLVKCQHGAAGRGTAMHGHHMVMPQHMQFTLQFIWMHVMLAICHKSAGCMQQPLGYPKVVSRVASCKVSCEYNQRCIVVVTVCTRCVL